MSALSVWIQFAVLALVISFAGYHLSYYADLISERTGLGRNWIGLILLATITSLPELVAGVSAVAIAQSPDLAVGDILGSCVFNLALVFVLDLLHRESSVYSRATQGHILAGALGIILLSFVGFGLVVGKCFPDFRVVHMGVYTLVIPFLYLLAMRTLYTFERTDNSQRDSAEPAASSQLPTSKVYAFFLLAAIVVVAAGSALPFVGEKITHVMGWNAAFVGTLFIALATSLPEMAVTVSSVRLGAAELAFSNLLGSNLFNVVILSVDDAFFRKGPLFANVSPVHAVTAFCAVMMTGLALVALIQKPQRRILNTVSGMSMLLVLVYLANSYIVFQMGN